MADKGEGGSHPRMSAGYPSGSSGHSEEPQGLKESAQEMASQLGESASGMAGQAQEAWRSAREGLQEGFSNLSARAGDIRTDAVDFVRRYPLASLAVAFGLGWLTSCALAAMPRSRDDMTERMSRASS